MSSKELITLIPDTIEVRAVTLNEELFPVVERISKFIPPTEIWRLFSSSPSETGGKATFPYSRIDSSVIVARDYAYLLRKYGTQRDESKYKEWYRIGSEQAFEALVWVEIGFEGLENLAHSPASRNWTSEVGHHVTPEERAIGIMTDGKQMYEKCLKSFVGYRQENNIHDDIFSQYGLEYLLEPFMSQSSSKQD